MMREIETYWEAVLRALRTQGWLLERPQQGGYVVPEATGFVFPEYCVFALDMQRLGNVTRERWLSWELRESISIMAGGHPVWVVDAGGLAVAVSRQPGMQRQALGNAACTVPTHLPLTTELLPAAPYAVCLGYGAQGAVTLDIGDEHRAILVGGTSGFGKTTFIQSVLVQLAAKHGPNEFRLVLLDPKLVDFTMYSELPQLLYPIANEIEECERAIEQTMGELLRRRALLAGARVPNWQQYNAGADETLPLILLVVDEAADFAGTPTMDTLVELARKGRAFGISVMVGTQHPTTKVIDAQVKANLPTAIAFRTKSNSDSRVILDRAGAEQLRDKGRCLTFVGGDWQEVQTCYVDEAAREALLGGLALCPEQRAGLDTVEAELVRYALLQLDGAFIINRLAEQFQGAISKRQLAKLARQWEHRGWLTGQADAASARYVTAELAELLTTPVQAAGVVTR